MFRKVVKTERYQPMNTLPPSFGIRDTLECGHIIYNKGSAGHAKKRHCTRCDHLKAGMISTVGGVRELWDAETDMPYVGDGSEVLR